MFAKRGFQGLVRYQPRGRPTWARDNCPISIPSCVGCSAMRTFVPRALTRGAMSANVPPVCEPQACRGVAEGQGGTTTVAKTVLLHDGHLAAIHGKHERPTVSWNLPIAIRALNHTQELTKMAVGKLL